MYMLYTDVCICIRVIYVVLQPNHRKTEKEVHFYTRLSLNFAHNFRIFFALFAKTLVNRLVQQNKWNRD